ncbi:MAG: ABC-type thiamine/hydroxymethylpyrimidine transport system permease subunit, partial [Maribacter sp.]
LALAIFSSISLLLFVGFIMGLSKKLLNMQTSYKKILFSFVLGLGIFILSANKNNSYLAFSLAPLSIIGANFVEDLKTNWVKETTLYIFFFLGVFFFVTQL